MNKINSMWWFGAGWFLKTFSKKRFCQYVILVEITSVLLVSVTLEDDNRLAETRYGTAGRIFLASDRQEMKQKINKHYLFNYNSKKEKIVLLRSQSLLLNAKFGIASPFWIKLGCSD